ncbi:hypothetical protein XENOCAPTIV_021996 [Xenoophorus captivus]|uniref:Uncharacterized protein n=1 Tax=Xenoophorus captivus TaxID=1517983 RepID=A0ABV0RKK5_9TELE
MHRQEPTVVGTEACSSLHCLRHEAKHGSYTKTEERMLFTRSNSYCRVYVYNWVYCNSGSPYHSKELSSPTEKVSCTLTQQVTLHNQVYLDAHLLPPHGSLTDCSFSVIALRQDKCMNVFMERTLRQEANYFIQFFSLVRLLLPSSFFIFIKYYDRNANFPLNPAKLDIPSSLRLNLRC